MAGKYGAYSATLTGDWAKLGVAFANLSVRFPQAMNSALVEEGEFYRNKMVQGIREQAPGGEAFRPLSPVTIALRKLQGFGGTKALIRTGELRNNIVSVPGKGFVFVGILYSARGQDGRNLAEIGRLNEYGGTVRSVISRKRMRMIAMAMRTTRGSGAPKGGAGIGFVQIPPRPFIRPVIAMYGGRRGAERYMARVARKVGGMLGVINHPDLGGFGAERLPERLARGRAGGFANALRSARKGATGQGLAKGPFSLKRSMNKSFSKARAGVKSGAKAKPAGAALKRVQSFSPVKLARPPKAHRAGKLIRPRKAGGGAPKRSLRLPRAAQKAPAQKAVRAPRVNPQRAQQRAARQVAAQQKRVAQIQARMAQKAQQALARAQTAQARAQKQALKAHLRANPQHNAHVRHRQMRMNLGHKV